MPSEHILGNIAQIPRGEGRNFEIGGTTIAVFRNYADEVFATQARCPHRSGPLADGLVGGTTLICPLHELAFDLLTGVGVGHEACLVFYPTYVGTDSKIRVNL